MLRPYRLTGIFISMEVPKYLQPLLHQSATASSSWVWGVVNANENCCKKNSWVEQKSRTLPKHGS